MPHCFSPLFDDFRIDIEPLSLRLMLREQRAWRLGGDASARRAIIDCR